MAALLNIDARQMPSMAVRAHPPLGRARLAMTLVVHELVKPALIMRWRIGSDGRPTGSWLPEALAILKNPDD